MRSIEKKTIDVLVVEDNRMGELLAWTILATKGYSVEVAESGIQALEMARAILPKVILLDVGLPDIDVLRRGCCARSDCVRSRQGAA